MRSDERLVGTSRNTPVDIRVVPPEDYGSTLCHATGSDAHLVLMTQRGLGDNPHASEDALYASLGLAFIPAELRQGTGEIEAAAAGRLPALVELADMRGDLHMHTTLQ